jgi:hypothetical protein
VEIFLKSYDDVEVKDGYYSLKDAHYYIYGEDFNINVPYRRNYDFFIIDAGVYGLDNPFIDEYERANVKGIVTTAREWEIVFLEEFLSNTENDQYDYLFNYADEKLYDFIVSNMNAGKVTYNTFRSLMECDLIDGNGLDSVYDEWLKRFISTPSKQTEKQGLIGRLLKRK